MQVQGEAIVRNNLLMNGKRAFASHDHQGASRDLVFVHNTLINPSTAAELSDWDGRSGMVFANNAVYSGSGEAVHFRGGSRNVIVRGNVAFGRVLGSAGGFVTGRGLQDFRGVAAFETRPGSSVDARPSPGGALVGSCAPEWTVPEDLTGKNRTDPPESGCYDSASKALR